MIYVDNYIDYDVIELNLDIKGKALYFLLWNLLYRMLKLFSS